MASGEVAVEEFLYIFFIPKRFLRKTALSRAGPASPAHIYGRPRGRVFTFEKVLLYGTLLKPPATQTPQMSLEQLLFKIKTATHTTRAL